MPELVDGATYSTGPPARPRGSRGRATEEQIAAWRALARAFAGATRAQETALGGTGLDLSEYDVLVTLSTAPAEGIRPGDLAERVLLTKSGMTRLVQRLEARSLLERHACPRDRRGQYVSLTPAGRRLLRRAAPGLLRGLASALAPLSRDELAALRRAAERMTEAAGPRSSE